ncbi:MAG: STAS domain-containing protein [Calditrichaeota bacterium]|nr:STAS domain-containing protein [Calditrichota bacterium]MCB0268260.1 STAS domain-containing protein [Calditrichota bacterium]MCB0286195.1 STAS domain-containing protein [Calditrichota bacterium]MCB0300227.1 STAS domain-containing protein [Calditrichota bacterium]MCB9067398.1 STAS domain-containing protein [Calditrichia bacterium]
MSLLKEQQNDVTVLRLQGDVMGGPEAVQINDEINQLLDNSTLKVVIDLAKVQRMNSSGLGILINALSTFKKNGGDLKLASPTPIVQNLLKITRLNSLFESYDTVDAAVASF